jgi:hypothetical protein
LLLKVVCTKRITWSFHRRGVACNLFSAVTVVGVKRYDQTIIKVH